MSQIEATAATSAPVATSAKCTHEAIMHLAAAERVQHRGHAHGPRREQREQAARSLPLLDH